MISTIKHHRFLPRSLGFESCIVMNIRERPKDRLRISTPFQIELSTDTGTSSNNKKSGRLSPNTATSALAMTKGPQSCELVCRAEFRPIVSCMTFDLARSIRIELQELREKIKVILVVCRRALSSLDIICFRMPESHFIPKYAVSVADGLVSNKEQILTQNLIGESD